MEEILGKVSMSEEHALIIRYLLLVKNNSVFLFLNMEIYIHNEIVKLRQSHKSKKKIKFSCTQAIKKVNFLFSNRKNSTGTPKNALP